MNFKSAFIADFFTMKAPDGGDCGSAAGAEQSAFMIRGDRVSGHRYLHHIEQENEDGEKIIYIRVRYRGTSG